MELSRWVWKTLKVFLHESVLDHDPTSVKVTRVEPVQARPKKPLEEIVYWEEFGRKERS